MPYIAEESRRVLDPHIEQLGVLVVTAGDLNYVFTRLALLFLKRLKLSYATLNAIQGVFSCASQEMYGRVVAPYENIKRLSNGDVPEYEEICRQLEV